MIVTIHPDAESDVVEAAAFYEQAGSPALAARFVAEFRRVTQLIAQNPGIGTPRARGRQFFPFRIFPYGLIYLTRPEDIHILVARRDRRGPGFGGARKPAGFGGTSGDA